MKHFRKNAFATDNIPYQTHTKNNAKKLQNYFENYLAGNFDNYLAHRVQGASLKSVDSVEGAVLVKMISLYKII